MKEIDARSLACPAPVLMTKDALDHGIDTVCVIVDNKASKENVSLFLQSKNFEISVTEKAGDFYITGKGEAASQELSEEVAETDTKKIMIMAASDCLGHGDDELGRKLMINFINTVNEMQPELWHLVFVNGGVKLTISGSPVLKTLKKLESDGLIILVCGTCLDHFKLLDAKQVGQTTNMLDIVTAMQLADKVITI